MVKVEARTSAGLEASEADNPFIGRVQIASFKTEIQLLRFMFPVYLFSFRFPLKLFIDAEDVVARMLKMHGLCSFVRRSIPTRKRELPVRYVKRNGS